MGCFLLGFFFRFDWFVFNFGKLFVVSFFFECLYSICMLIWSYVCFGFGRLSGEFCLGRWEGFFRFGVRFRFLYIEGLICNRFCFYG